MKLYCTVYYRTCAYAPCGKLFVNSYLNVNRKMCSSDCVVLAARYRTTPAELARRGRMAAGVQRRSPTFPAAACKHCGADFTPRHGATQWCSTCAPDLAAKHRLKRYGVSEPEWQELLARHDGMCWICRVVRAAVLDHDHLTGAPRGALCTGCNVKLFALEDPDWTSDARNYLGAWEARGHDEWHQDYETGREARLQRGGGLALHR